MSSMLRYFLVGLFLNGICLAQEPELSGIVLDKTTGEPVIFAHVYLANTILGCCLVQVFGWAFGAGSPGSSYTTVQVHPAHNQGLRPEPKLRTRYRVKDGLRARMSQTATFPTTFTPATVIKRDDIPRRDVISLPILHLTRR